MKREGVSAEMKIYDENRVGIEEQQEKGMNNRRALKDIRNFMGAPPFPKAVSKRGLQDENAFVDQKNVNLTRRTETSGSVFVDQKKNVNLIRGTVTSENALVDQNNANLSHRPVTRKFAASLKLQPALSKEPKLESISVYIDGSESEELEMELKEELEEIEMQDIFADEPVMDIDLADAKNPLAVVDYVEDIYEFYFESEASAVVSPNYMANQTDINEKMRAILVDWLIEVHHKFDLMDETLFLMVNIVDRFLSRQSIVRKKLQLVGITAMLLACKYEEVSVPVVNDLIVICDHAYSRSEILNMERLMVNALQFNMSVPTCYAFMRRFLKAAECDRELELHSSYMIELCLVEYEMLNHPPSLLAAAAVYTAQSSLRKFSNWTKTLEFYTGYTEDQLLACSRKMVEFHRNAGKGKLTGVHRKYSTSKFGYAARSEPALFLLSN